MLNDKTCVGCNSTDCICDELIEGFEPMAKNPRPANHKAITELHAQLEQAENRIAKYETFISLINAGFGGMFGHQDVTPEKDCYGWLDKEVQMLEQWLESPIKDREEFAQAWLKGRGK